MLGLFIPRQSRFLFAVNLATPCTPTFRPIGKNELILYFSPIGNTILAGGFFTAKRLRFVCGIKVCSMFYLFVLHLTEGNVQAQGNPARSAPLERCTFLRYEREQKQYYISSNDKNNYFKHFLHPPNRTTSMYHILKRSSYYISPTATDRA